LAVLLVTGTVLLAAGAAAHPMLPADAAGQLRMIGTTPYWRVIHMVMIAGSGLLIAGLWTRLYATGSGAWGALIPALVTIAAGLALNAYSIEFMERAGTAEAARYLRGDAGMVAEFAAGHTVAVGRARLGNAVVALGCLLLGWAEWQDPQRPRWVAALAWVASIGGLVGWVAFKPGTPGGLAAVALLSGWALATAVLAIRPAAAHSSPSGGTA
jgi:hypothetical protein